MLVVAMACTCSPEVAKRCLSCRALLVLDFSSRSAVCSAARQALGAPHGETQKIWQRSLLFVEQISQSHALPFTFTVTLLMTRQTAVIK